MIAYSVISKSQLEGTRRLDAEYYQPEYLEIVQKIQSVPHTSLDSYAEKVFSGPLGSTLKSESYQETGVPFIRISDISDLFIDQDTLVFISPSEHKRIYSTHLSVGDIVLSKIGTVGRLSVISEELGEVNISENNIGIRLSKLPEEKKIALLFLLLGKYGQKQLLRKASGNIQLKLNVSDVESIQVPIFDEVMLRALMDIYTDFLSKRNESDSLYLQAENLLLEKLGLKNFKADEDLYSVVNFSNIKSANRMDAEYFQPKYERLIVKLKAQKAQPLVDVLESISAKFNPLTQADKIFKYVELSNINGSIGIIDGYTETSGREAPSRAKRVLKKGDVVVSTVEGSLGKVALVHKEQEGCLASTGFFQFRSEDLLPEVLLVIAKSFIFHNQLEQRCAGTILTAVPKDSIKDILVPILPKATQEKIAGLVRESHTARKKAKELLEEAKRTVEEFIEQKTK